MKGRGSAVDEGEGATRWGRMLWEWDGSGKAIVNARLQCTDDSKKNGEQHATRAGALAAVRLSADGRTWTGGWTVHPKLKMGCIFKDGFTVQRGTGVQGRTVTRPPAPRG